MADGLVIAGMLALQIGREIRHLIRLIIEGQLSGAGIEDEIKGVGVVLFHRDPALDAQFGGGCEKIDERDGVTKNIMDPAHTVLRADFQRGRADLHVMPLQRPHHEPVRAQCDGLAVAIDGDMRDAQQHNMTGARSLITGALANSGPQIFQHRSGNKKPRPIAGEGLSA
jgi:hypothetical protein